MFNIVSRSLGSVIFPVNAAAAAVSGLHKYILSSNVPERPGKLRGIVLRLMVFVAGACPIPMHPMHPDWWRRAPAAIKGPRAPISIKFSNTCRDEGLTSKEISGETAFPFTIWETIQKSRNPGFADEPITTWFTVSPLTSLTVTTSPGLPGSAIKGSTADKSISISLS